MTSAELGAPEPQPEPQPDAQDPADAVVAAVLAVPGVSGLHAGPWGQVGTYLPGRRVDGVRLREDDCEVHVTVAMGSVVVDVAEAVRSAVAPIVGTPVSVVVEDVTPA